MVKDDLRMTYEALSFSNSSISNFIIKTFKLKRNTYFQMQPNEFNTI